MSKYQPNKFLVLKITDKKSKVHYRVFGTWSGGYLDGDSWRLNSGIEAVEAVGPLLLFHGSSGSVYEVHKDMYGSTAWTSGVVEGWKKDHKDGGPHVEILDNQDWTQFNFKGEDNDR